MPPANLQKAKSMFMQTGGGGGSGGGNHSHFNAMKQRASSSSRIVHHHMDNVDDLINETLDWLFRFKSLLLQQEYISFNKSRTSTRSTLLLSILLTLFTIPYLLFILVSIGRNHGVSSSDNHPESNRDELEVAMAVINILCVPVILVLLWLVYYVQWAKSHKYMRYYPHSFTTKHLLHRLGVIQTLTYFIMIVYYCLRLVLRVLRGQCDEEVHGSRSNSLTAWACNPLAESHNLPQDSMLSIMFIPMMLSLIWKEIHFSVVCGCWIGTVVTFVFSAVYVEAYGMIPLMLAYLFAGPLAYYEYMKQNVIMFSMTQKLRDALDDNEKMADEVHASEMRSMIGNVAHDLKTPLTSFVNGIDFIDQVTRDLKDVAAASKTITSKDLEECVQSIRTCVQNIKNTNSFMLMTINRCIDYTKASKGLKLVPKNETIDLMETLALPLNCMKDIQSRVTIRLMDFSEDICSHIITDRQWLQENVLCLLSNAVKYSMEGEVTLSLKLKRIGNVEGSGGGGMFDQVKALFFTHSPAQGDKTVSYHGLNIPTAVDEEGNSTTHRMVSLDDSITEGTGNHSLNDNNFNAAMVHPDFSHPPSMATSPTAATATSCINVPTVSSAAAKYLEGSSKTQKRRPNVSPQPEIMLVIEVEDHGVGIDESLMETLFTPFKQAQRLAGGTGLGLFSLAKRVEALNGRCGVSNRRDGEQGSLFWFEIPYRPDKIYAALHKKVSDRRNSFLRANMSMLPSSNIMSALTNGLVGSRGSAKIIPTTTTSFIKTSPVGGDIIAEHMEMSDLSVNTATIRHEMHTMSNQVIPFSNYGGISATPLIAELHVESTSTRDMSRELAIAPENIIPAPVAPVISVSQTNTTKKQHDQLKILVVDDAPSIVKMTSMMLKRQGHSIVSAENGEEALKRVFEQVQTHSVPFDVILMDLQMPVMDGLEAARRLRALEASGVQAKSHGFGIRSSLLQSISKSKMSSSHSLGLISADSGIQKAEECATTMMSPYSQHKPLLSGLHHIIIGVSACSDDDTTDAAYESGFDAFLPKPFSMDSFYSTFQRLRSQY